MNIQQTLTEYFSWFHQHPEPSFGEHETTRRIKSILEETGAEILPSGLETGLIARVTNKNAGEKNERVVAIRADIDALPINEQTNLDCVSQNAGLMHACGHDFHICALLGCARLLCESRSSLAGEVKLIFQPAEELSEGAQKILSTGLLDDVKEIYGLHVLPELSAGTVAVSAGSAYAGVGRFRITVRGKGGHAGIPHLAVDPVIICAHIIQAAQTVISRNADPLEPAVLSITRVEAGSTWNVIPDTGFLEGTIRIFDNEQWERISGRLKKICDGAALAFGADIYVEINKLSPPTNNNAALTEFVRETARDIGLHVVQSAPRMTGEDFALYQEKIPGVFLQFGVSSPFGLHHPKFCADISFLSRAAELLFETAKRALAR